MTLIKTAFKNTLGSLGNKMHNQRIDFAVKCMQNFENVKVVAKTMCKEAKEFSKDIVNIVDNYAKGKKNLNDSCNLFFKRVDQYFNTDGGKMILRGALICASIFLVHVAVATSNMVVANTTLQFIIKDCITITSKMLGIYYENKIAMRGVDVDLVNNSDDVGQSIVNNDIDKSKNNDVRDVVNNDIDKNKNSTTEVTSKSSIKKSSDSSAIDNSTIISDNQGQRTQSTRSISSHINNTGKLAATKMEKMIVSDIQRSKIAEIRQYTKSMLQYSSPANVSSYQQKLFEERNKDTSKYKQRTY